MTGVLAFLYITYPHTYKDAQRGTLIRDNALLRMDLRRKYIPNRYIFPQLLNIGSHGVICTVSESNHPNQMFVAKAHRKFQTIRQEIMNYRYVQSLSGFARCYDAFTMPLSDNANLTRSRFCHIMITEHVGECLQDILKRSGVINQKNVITLGYKLFYIVESLHAARLVHRNISLKNVMLQRMSNVEVRMLLIGLDDALPLDPSPVDNFDVVSQDSSPFVDDGNPYQKFDDFISGIYLILRLSGIDIFENTGGDFRRIANQKQRFHQNPHGFLNNENAWIGHLYNEIQAQRVNGYNHYHIFQNFQQAIPNFVPVYNETIFLS
ncbi:hypothetical protein L3Y34_011626 [Caenorhabditis briggsae]|uniref:Protein kinase domain-containing protein n=2 Tax=Caenorhabditis briggsae TaxID=6238 RepID=A0AAE8ZWR2_CAEBR|nr:hypothetical protein L3Y34_011626 [Caenorhabditis briggsae]